ncbi:MAG: very-short-patch-repair endonuclease [Oleispira sp.]|jgi:very-short-patch-repair endonuclease
MENYLDKKEYIVRQLARTKHKKYEQYVVTRIINLLNDLDIKFVTQQYVSRPEGRALTDLFFPQLAIHVEVDEPHHKSNVDVDSIREADIVNATNHEINRIDVDKSIQEINSDIDRLIQVIKSKVHRLKKSGDFYEWDINAEFKSETYIEKGYIDIADDVKFRQIKDACNCFGYSYKGCQKGLVIHRNEVNTAIWFPRLNPIAQKAPKDGEWDNRISQNEEIITTSHLTDNAKNEQILNDIKCHTGDSPKRVVFVRVKGNLGMVLYRFRGLYELSIEESLSRGVETWVRIANRVKTYPNS